MKVDIENTITCPFCGAENNVWQNENGIFWCPDCERTYTFDEYEHEFYRKVISTLCTLYHATESEPIDCTTGREDLHIFGEVQGISEIEKPLITAIFQDQEGIIWANIYGCDEPQEIDDFSTSDLYTIYGWLNNNL